ncbi:MAG: bifunctional hexulose-6-phosphate synthase/ribonuclease regulator [Verrucomicrobia bacterium]|nr:bifunctional hexulose-6-phosphate synthase/ribonuclease regulator [Verrucomicrobiota bacterium]
MSLLSSLQQLAEYDTALIANTIGYLDPTPAHEFYMGGSIASVTPTLGPTVGVAFTCEVDTSSPQGPSEMEPYFQMLKEMEKVKLPIVLVAKTVGSRPDHECVLGDGMAKMLHAAGCIGVVTDGGVRDVEGMLGVPFAAYCRGRTIHHTAIRFKSVNQPIEIGGITVRHHDVIHANFAGVIKVPSGCVDRLPERATAMRAFEHDVHCVWRQSGISIDDKRACVPVFLKKHGFPSK